MTQTRKPDDLHDWPDRGRLEVALLASAAWQRASTLDELARMACMTLLELIPCDAVAWNEVDVDGRSVRVHTLPDVPYDHEALERLIHTHPFVRHVCEHGDLEARTISDFLGEREFHRTELYRQVYRAAGVEDQLGATVRVEAGRCVAIAFNRGARTFTAADRTLLDLLRPHLAAAYAHVRGAATERERAAELQSRLEAGAPALLFTRKDGTAVDLSTQARALLERWFGRVPERIEPGEYESDDGVLHVRTVGGRQGMLLLDERRFVVDAERGGELGLTARETEVLTLAGRGLTDRRIAARLVISERTVQKHLEHVYEKLGVRRRGEAIARLRAAKAATPARTIPAL